MSCVMSSTPTPSSFICLKWFSVSFTVFWSSPGVGSSATTSFGLDSSAVETSTLLAIPPDSWNGYISSTSGPRL